MRILNFSQDSMNSAPPRPRLEVQKIAEKGHVHTHRHVPGELEPPISLAHGVLDQPYYVESSSSSFLLLLAIKLWGI